MWKIKVNCKYSFDKFVSLLWWVYIVLNTKLFMLIKILNINLLRNHVELEDRYQNNAWEGTRSKRLFN